MPVALEELRKLVGEHYSLEVVDAACEALRDVQPPPVADQLPKTPLERQRFAYFFDDQLTGAHNANYLQFMLRNGLPAHLGHGYVVLLRNFSVVNMTSGWSAGSQALAGFAAALMGRYPDALVFRVMGDDFLLLASRRLEIDGAYLKTLSPLEGTQVEVEVRELDPHGADREYLQGLL